MSELRFSKRRGSHFKLFSDELPLVFFDESLETNKPHFRDVKKLEHHGEHNIVSLPLSDRTGSGSQALLDKLRPRSQSPKVFPMLRKLSKEHHEAGNHENSAFGSLLSKGRRRPNQFDFGGYIPSHLAGEQTRKHIQENNHVNTNWKREMAKGKEERDFEFLTGTFTAAQKLKIPEVDTSPYSRGMYAVPSPRRRRTSNEQITLMVHDSGGSLANDTSVTMALGRTGFQRRKHGSLNSDMSDPMLHDPFSDQDGFHKTGQKKDFGPYHKQTTVVNRHGGRRHSEVHTQEMFLSRLNAALREYTSQVPSSESSSAKGEPAGKSKRITSTILPPITERKSVAGDVIEVEDSVETQVSRIFGNPEKHSNKGNKATKGRRQVGGNKGETETSGTLRKRPKRQNGLRFKSGVGSNTSSGNSEIATKTGTPSTDDIRDLDTDDDDDLIDRSMTGAELLKAYRIWDRKRRKFPNGLRKITIPEYRKDENDAFLKLLASAEKASNLLRKKKSGHIIAPLNRISDSLTNDTSIP